MTQTPDTPTRWAKDLMKVDPHTRPYELLREFLALAYCAQAKLTALTPEAADAFEARYMETVKRQRRPETIQRMPEMMARAVLAVSDGGQDFLGSVAGEFGALDPKYLGQCFTPYAVSKLIAGMTMGDTELTRKAIEEKGYINICEPASGAGGMAIAAADVLEEQGFDISREIMIHATDVSEICYHMTFL